MVRRPEPQYSQQDIETMTYLVVKPSMDGRVYPQIYPLFVPLGYLNSQVSSRAVPQSGQNKFDSPNSFLLIT
jgi:hypothetical protein